MRFIIGTVIGLALFLWLAVPVWREQNRRAKSKPTKPPVKTPQCDNCGAFHDPPRNDNCFMVKVLGVRSIRVPAQEDSSHVH